MFSCSSCLKRNLQDIYKPRQIKIYQKEASSPVKKPKYEEEPFFTKIVSGPFHNAALDRRGRLFTWGER